MGFSLFGKSSSSSSSSHNEYNTDNTNLGATEGGVALRDSTYTLNTFDPGAFDLATNALTFVEKTYKESLKSVTDAVGQAAKQTTDTLAHYQTQARDSFSDLVKLSSEQNKQGVQALTEDVFKYGMYALVGISLTAAIGYGMSRRKKAA